MEWEEAKALRRMEVTGRDRDDYGRAKAAYFVASAMAKLNNFDISKLLPIQHEKPSQTPEELLVALEAFSQSWQPKASAP
jgi:hypothetical protein